MTQLDKAFFGYVSGLLRGASTDKIVGWYVQNLILHDGDYLKYLQREYKLPNDILKMHTKIEGLSC